MSILHNAGAGCSSTSALASLVVAFVTAAEPASAWAAEAPRRPNVLLVMPDDQGYGDLGFHGNERIDTPVMDRLARESTRFDRFFVCPLCTPSRASLLTGRYYLRTGVASVTRGLETLRSEEVTIAEVLKSAGYATGCFGKWHLGEHYPNHPNGQGFDEFFGMPTGHWDNYFDPVLDHNGRPVRTTGYITDVLTDAAIRFVEEHRDRPFFCYVPYNAPHTPLQVSDAYFDKYKARGLDDRTAAIYGMVENIDENLGRLIGKLDELELAENTIVLFLSDNGPEGPEGSRYNAGMRGMKGRVHEGGVRVPLFVRWPGRIRAGAVVGRIAAHVDLLPTIAELCKVPMPETRPLDGRSLVPLVEGQAGDWPDRMIFSRMPNWKRLVSYREPVIDDLEPFPAAVRTQRWRIVNEGSGWELYDMTADPGQTTNVAPENPKIVDRLTNAYQAWFSDVTREPIERPPIPVGYPERPAVELPAPEAYFTGRVRWYNQHGFAHDWLTGWTNTEDEIWWEVDVASAGRYEVTLMVTCPPEAIGTTLRVEAAGSAVEGSIQRAYDPQPVLRPSRQRKNRYTQTFAPLKLGQIQLGTGRVRITLKALDKPAERVCDLKSLWLERLD
ncbi:MAG: arylsulfatase [Planctomycetota bacterium]